MKRHRVVLALLGGLAGPLSVQANDAEALIERMVGATKQLDYDGVFVYQRDGTLETLRVIHRGSGPTEMERLVSLSGPAREVIRDGRRVAVRSAASAGDVMVAERAPPKPPKFTILGDASGLAAVYHLSSQQGLDRVAGRQARVVEIKPRKADRYGYKLWVDEDTGLLLKTVILDERQRVLELEQFADIKIGMPLEDAIFATDLPDMAPAADAPPTTQEPTTTGSADWTVGWLPEGFSRHKEFSCVSNAAVPKPVRQFMYSDGLASVSVFVEALHQGATPMQGFALMGAVNSYSRVTEGHQVTVVGEMPQATVRKIALSVAPRN